MPDSLLEKVACAGWNDTDPLSLAKARAVLHVVRKEVEAMRDLAEHQLPHWPADKSPLTRESWKGQIIALDEVAARFPEETG